MIYCFRISYARILLLIVSFGLQIPALAFAATAPSEVLRAIDASVARRDNDIASYTVTERYALYRHDDLRHAAAEMTVKTKYSKELGKRYTVLTQSGSALLRREILARVLESEQTMTQPVNRPSAVITSANYSMQPGQTAEIDGRKCIMVSLEPRRDSPYLFRGTLWVDATNEDIVQLKGVASKSPSFLAGTTQVARTYQEIDGYPMATHASATASSWLLGETTIQIDYTGYQIEVEPKP